jgi:ABC-type multidrug transport system fused ATPase/permease subunit
MSLPDGFQTQVGPRGLKLSGGQKQRIALARLFISNPDIILLDEATAALDNETERFVQDSLNAFHDKTMIVVAHRLSTIKDSDKIIVVNNHNIVQCGTHDELLKEDGIYAKMYRASLK